MKATAQLGPTDMAASSLLLAKNRGGGGRLKIFVGYPSEHEKTAWEVYEFLKSKGDDVWFDKKSLVAGVDWDQERDKGQREAELVVHLCSGVILKRAGVVNREIRQTLRLVEDQPLGALYVIPIRLEPVKLPVELTRFHYFDFGDDWKERLSEGVEKRRAQLSGAALPSSKQIVVEETALKGAQKIEFEDITPSYECRGEYFRYDEEGLYWRYVNAAIASDALKGFYSSRSGFKRLFGDYTDEIEKDGLKHEWSVSAEEFFRSGDMVSVRFYTYIGYARAAHPNHYITTANFFGDDAGSLEIRELLGHSTENARKIIGFCEKVILAEFEGEIERDSFFEGYKENEEDLWRLLGQFGFDRRGLTFNFSPYDVLPFVFGSHEVQVPWRFLDDLIADDYKDVVERLRKGS
jgi:hypothetical protein